MSRARNVRAPKNSPEATYAGKKVSELVAGAWFDVLVNDQALRLDRDQDGLTDLVENLLGTDPSKADTDGDGDPDGVDPCPNAAPRMLSDEEAVLAAVVEARYHFDESEGPALATTPKGMKPFELVGRRGPTICLAEGDTSEGGTLSANYELGIAMIDFHGDAPKGSKTWPAMNWNQDHSQASLIISTYFGGLNGTGYRAIVRKFGSDWVVVSMGMEYIS